MDVPYQGGALFVIGTLQNSGIYACYLVISLPFCYLSISSIIRFIRKKYSRSRKAYTLSRILIFSTCTVFTIAVGTLVYLTQSRTALIAGCTLTFTFIYLRYGQRAYKLLVKKKQRVLGLIVLALAILLLGVFLLFKLRKLSVIGRILKIRVALEHLTENFWFGTGLGRFTWYYPQWQSDFFSRHSKVPEYYTLTADDSFLLFNEFLQLYLEVGVIGFIVFIATLVYFFKTKSFKNKSLLISSKLTVIAILSCGFTTYALHVNLFLLLLAFCLSIGIICRFGGHTLKVEIVSHSRGCALEKTSGSKMRYSCYLKLTFLLLFILWTICIYRVYNCNTAIDKWSTVDEFYSQTEPKFIQQYTELYGELRHNGKFLATFGIILSNDSSKLERAASLLEESHKLFICRETVEILANVYFKLNRKEDAIRMTKWLTNYLPGRFSIKQDLMQLYIQKNDIKSAKEVALQILRTPIKIPSPKVDEVRSQAVNVLEGTNF